MNFSNQKNKIFAKKPAAFPPLWNLRQFSKILISINQIFNILAFIWGVTCFLIHFQYEVMINYVRYSKFPENHRGLERVKLSYDGRISAVLMSRKHNGTVAQVYRAQATFYSARKINHFRFRKSFLCVCFFFHKNILEQNVAVPLHQSVLLHYGLLFIIHQLFHIHVERDCNFIVYIVDD